MLHQNSVLGNSSPLPSRFPNTSRVLVEYKYSLIINLSTWSRSGYTSLWAAKDRHSTVLNQSFPADDEEWVVHPLRPQEVPGASPLGNLLVVGDVQPNRSLRSAVYVYCIIMTYEAENSIIFGKDEMCILYVICCILWVWCWPKLFNEIHFQASDCSSK